MVAWQSEAIFEEFEVGEVKDLNIPCKAKGKHMHYARFCAINRGLAARHLGYVIVTLIKLLQL